MRLLWRWKMQKKQRMQRRKNSLMLVRGMVDDDMEHIADMKGAVFPDD